jgi:carbon storage regulator
MLVLSRKLNEKIVIDGGIVVTVVKIDRNQVRIGIEAPDQVRVFREEIMGTAARPAAHAVHSQHVVELGV